MTIRSDVEAIGSAGVVRRVVGGAIAVVVADLIGLHETLILDFGSTALAVANWLKGRGLGLTVVTPSVLAALALVDEPDTTVVLTGGELRAAELSLIGPSAEDTLADYNCDTYVMGVAGVDVDRGISDYHRAESPVKRAASKRADRVIVAADTSKIGRVAFVTSAALAQVQIIVSDGPAGPSCPGRRTGCWRQGDLRCRPMWYILPQRRGAMTRHTLGVDVGTTATRTVLLDKTAAGRASAQRASSRPPRRPRSRN